MLNRFTPSACRIVFVATEEARGLGHGEIGPEHLLLGALRSGGASAFALAQLGLREGAVRARIGMMLPRGNAEIGTDISLSTAAVWAFAGAVRLADDGDEPQIGSGQILRALVDAPGARDVLAACAISGQAVGAALRTQPKDGDESFAATIAAVDDGDAGAAARALLSIVVRRGPVAAWLAERGIDAAAVRRSFPALELELERSERRAARGISS